MASVTGEKLVELSDHWLVPLSGMVVSQCRYDFALTLVIGEAHPSYVLRISEDFKFESPRSGPVWVHPETDVHSMAPTLHLLRLSVEHASALKGGELELSFEDGSRLLVPSSPDYESWTLTGSDGLRLVSAPSGELVIWT